MRAGLAELVLGRREALLGGGPEPADGFGLVTRPAARPGELEGQGELRLREPLLGREAEPSLRLCLVPGNLLARPVEAGQAERGLGLALLRGGTEQPEGLVGVAGDTPARLVRSGQPQQRVGLTLRGGILEQARRLGEERLGRARVRPHRVAFGVDPAQPSLGRGVTLPRGGLQPTNGFALARRAAARQVGQRELVLRLGVASLGGGAQSRRVEEARLVLRHRAPREQEHEKPSSNPHPHIIGVPATEGSACVTWAAARPGVVRYPRGPFRGRAP